MIVVDDLIIKHLVRAVDTFICGILKFFMEEAIVN